METRTRKKVNQGVFVTVGTTQFDQLVEAVCEEKTLKVFERLILILPVYVIPQYK